MRKLILSLSAATLAMAGADFAPRLLAAPSDRATALLLASGLFTIAIAAVVRD